MPELPEAESARAVLAHEALGRVISEVDDADRYVCRPHAPAEIRTALVGRQLTGAHRRGKSIWCDTSGLRPSGPTGPVLGIHLGMSGKIVVADGAGHEVDGGDRWRGDRPAGDYRFTRFRLTFADGGSLLLLDPRRLGRVRLDPPVDALGPDAREITPAQFRAVMTGGTAPVKARLLDQRKIAGIGNLLADQILWQARVSPARPASDLSRAEVTRLLRSLRQAVESAVSNGGVHRLAILPARRPGASCPRCGAPMIRAAVGGRTTWWCPREQR